MSRPHAPLFAALVLCAAFASAQAQEAPSPPAGPVPVEPVPPDAPAPGEATPPEPAPADPTTEAPPPDVSGAEGTAVEGATAGSPAAEDPRTDEERAYDALYVDPTLPAPAALPEAYDPWEPFNRRMHRFNAAVDRRIARPLAVAYVAAVPRPVRLGVSNFFQNLGQPVTVVNSLLQGKPKQAAQALGRFVLNSTLGIGGIFDPANDANLPQRREDFGQTLGVWGWKQSRYVELPLFGPRTLRDVLGMSADAPLAPIRSIEEDKVRVFLQGLQLVDVRTQLLAVDSMREGATDEYALVRDAWLQRRHYQIFGDRQLEDDASLPDYLRDEQNPTVPVDAIPVPPSDGS